MWNRHRFIPTLALKFLMSKSSDGFISLIAWISVTGVALGMLALTLVTSVINGFQGELRRVITSMNGEVILYTTGHPVTRSDLVEEKIRRLVPETQALTESFLMELMISGPGGVAGAILDGFTAETLGFVTSIPKNVVDGVLPDRPGQVALGTSLAERIGAKVGDEIRLIVPFTQASEDEAGIGTPKVGTARVVGLVRMGMHQYDSKFVFAPIGFVQDFVGRPDHFTTFRIRLMPGTVSRDVSARLSENFGYPFRSRDWSQMNQNILYAVELEKVVIAIILTVIVIVASFNVISTLMMMIHDKTREIAILKAMGLLPSQSFFLFCFIGTGIGALGVGTGLIGGLFANEVLSRTRLIELPAEVYYIGFLPVVVRWSELTLISFVALLICFTATVYPSWRVARRSALEGLRYD